MIFFSEDIPKFKAGADVINPIPCELKDGRRGYFLGDDWQIEIEAKGATVEQIEKSQINQKSHY